MLTSKLFATEPFKTVYSEAVQNNPLRWCMYSHNEEDGKFYAQTAKFKCKDFFNEIVKLYNTGKTAKIYAFTTEGMQLNPYGVFIRLYNVKKDFYNNIEIINELLREQLGVELNPVPVENKKGECLLLLPRSLFNSTYIISKVSLWIRACNADAAYTSYDDMKDNSPESLMVDCTDQVQPPEKFREYWFYASSAANSKVEPDSYISIIHNNGFFDWEAALKREGY